MLGGYGKGMEGRGYIGATAKVWNGTDTESRENVRAASDGNGLWAGYS